MSDISLRYEEREGIGKFLIGSVYSQSVSKDDTITVYKKDYVGVVLRIKTDAAVDVTLDSVAANLKVPEAGVDTFIDVNETIASFAGSGETVVNLADALTKKWAVAFPYLRFKFNAAATVDFVVTATTDISSIVTVSQNLTEIAGTALTGRDWSADFANLDIALSSLRDALRGTGTKDFTTLESDIEDIRNALSSVGTDKLLTTPDNPSNLDVSLSTQAKLERWGRAVEPEWTHAAEVTAPSAGTALVTKSVGTGKTGYIYGFFISAGEANDFKINWTTGGNAKSIRIPFSGKGSLQYVDFAALNEGMGADAGTDITITNVNAGGSGVVYQARILYAEV